MVHNLSGALQRLLGDQIDLILNLAPSAAPIKAGLDHIASILIHLALRARDAMSNGGRFTIETASVERQPPSASTPGASPGGSYAVLTVHEMGTEGRKPDPHRSFSIPLATVEEDLRTALRLAMVGDIVKRAGGYCDVTGKPGQGLSIRVLFPLAVNQPLADEPA
jgi:two-component system cell cycle sensor histidine kinase/response regulator CckA